MSKLRSLLPKNYVRMAPSLISAFIFMMTKAMTFVMHRFNERQTQIVDPTYNIHLLTPELILLHLEGTPEQSRRKDYVDNLLEVYRPLARNLQGVSIFNVAATSSSAG